jgi:predicted dehydrogenase
MLKIGIVGAENSHAAEVAKLCNVEKRVDARVRMIWGEKDEFAQKTAAEGRIPLIVKDWREMLGKVDGVMIDHRHAKDHFEPAKFFLSNGVPTFVDKPFSFTLAEGKKLVAIARRSKTPVTSYSSNPLQQNFSDFKAAVARLGEVYSLATAGPADIKSKWGGIFFYGIHQVDAIVALLGLGVGAVQLLRHGDNALAFLTYPKGPVVTMTCINRKGFWDFHWTAIGEKGAVDWRHQNDANPLLKGLQTFLKMFETREQPFEARRILAPIAVLEAMAKSLRTGKRVKVAKV